MKQLNRLPLIYAFPLFLIGLILELPPAAHGESQQDAPQQQPAAREAEAEKDAATTATSEAALARLAEIEKKAMAHWQDVKTLRANLVTKEDHPEESANPDQEGGGYYDVLHEGDKSYHRLALLTDLADRGGERVNTWSRMTTLYDGEYVWVLRETPQRKVMIKVDRPAQQPLELIGPGLYQTLREFKSLSFQPDAELEGRRVHVLQAQTTNDRTEITFNIDAETGMATKVVLRDTFQNAVKTMEVIGADFEAEFSEDHFDSTPPEGVDVRDFTREAQAAELEEINRSKEPTPENANAADDE